MGKLAKPQRSKKHKKIKAVDPFYVGDRPADRHAHKYDEKPRNDTEQEFSRSVREIMKLKNDVRTSAGKKRKKRHLQNTRDSVDFNDNLSAADRGVTKPARAVPDFKRRRDESDRAFLFRVNRETAATIQKAKFDDKYDVDADELDNSKGSSQSRQTQEEHIDRRKLRLQKRKAKLADKKRQKHEDRVGGFAALKDDVKFGEVAHQPPSFSAKPRKAPDVKTSRPGTKSSLLLTKMLTSSQNSPICDEDTVSRKCAAATARRLSMSQRAALELERERVIQLYRELKTEQQQDRGVLTG